MGQTRAPFAGTEDDASQSKGSLSLNWIEADVPNISRGNDNNFISVYRPIAMDNPNTRCYVNSSAQGILNCNTFYRTVKCGRAMQEINRMIEQQSNDLLEAFQQIINAKKNKKKTQLVCTERLRALFDQFTNKEWQDISDFLLQLVGALKPLENVCTSKVRESSTCQSCQQKSEKETISTLFSVPLNGSTVDQNLTNYWSQRETFKAYCDLCCPESDSKHLPENQKK